MKRKPGTGFVKTSWYCNPLISLIFSLIQRQFLVRAWEKDGISILDNLPIKDSGMAYRLVTSLALRERGVIFAAPFTKNGNV
jgi:hypothetical protein